MSKYFIITGLTFLYVFFFGVLFLGVKLCMPGVNVLRFLIVTLHAYAEETFNDGHIKRLTHK